VLNNIRRSFALNEPILVEKSRVIQSDGCRLSLPVWLVCRVITDGLSNSLWILFHRSVA